MFILRAYNVRASLRTPGDPPKKAHYPPLIWGNELFVWL